MRSNYDKYNFDAPRWVDFSRMPDDEDLSPNSSIEVTERDAWFF